MQIHPTRACLRKREPLKPCQVDAYLNLGQDLRRMMVNASLVVGEVRTRLVTPLGTDDGVWPVRLAVGTQALGQRPQAAHPLLHHRLRTVVGHRALYFLLLLCRRAGGWDQMLAGLLGRLVLGGADPELLRIGLWDLSTTSRGSRPQPR